MEMRSLIIFNAVMSVVILIFMMTQMWYVHKQVQAIHRTLEKVKQIPHETFEKAFDLIKISNPIASTLLNTLDPKDTIKEKASNYIKEKTAGYMKGLI